MKKTIQILQVILSRFKIEASLKTILITCSFLILAAIMINSIISNIQLQYQKSQLSTKVFELNNESKSLSLKLEQSSTNRHVEEIAREKLGMVKSSELPINVIEENENESAQKMKAEDKMGIYIEDWYSGLEDWVHKMKLG